MERSGASSYVYAKASGMLSKAFVGSRTKKLFETKTLQELWALVFSSEVPMVPEVLLAKEIELKAESKFIKDFSTLLSMYSEPDEILVTMLRVFDIENIKEISASLCLGEKIMPNINDIGSYSVINYSGWPNLAKMTKDSPIPWLSKVPILSEQKDIDARLDTQYIRHVWFSIDDLPLAERNPVKKLLGEEIRLNNISWALRLKVYYNMPNSEIILRLASLSDTPDTTDVLAGDAIKILDYQIDSYDDWEKWQYSAFLNHHEEGVVWNIDPRCIENSAKLYIQKKALRQFHQYPFTANVLVTWFKIKEYELDCIRTAAEGIRLNVPPSRMMELAGLSE